MTHELKIWPQFFAAVKDGSKTFEVRENDRGFQKGDFVILKEWNPPTQSGDPGQYTGNERIFTVGYVLPIVGSLVAFSLLPTG